MHNLSTKKAEVLEYYDGNDHYYFDNENSEDFITWYSKHDRNGCYSSMLVHFPRYSEKITKDNINHDYSHSYRILELEKTKYYEFLKNAFSKK